jgi:hypothetical protein
MTGRDNIVKRKFHTNVMFTAENPPLSKAEKHPNLHGDIMTPK